MDLRLSTKYISIKVITLVLFVFYCTGFLLAQQPDLNQIKKHVMVLASDSLKGRGNGDDGLEKAANYIAESFKQSGLKPMPEGTYYHEFQLKKKRKNFVAIQNQANLLIWPWHFHFVSGYNQNDTIVSNLIFTGFGTPNELETLNLTNKIIAFIAHSPIEAYNKIKSIKLTYGNTNFVVLFPHKNKMIDEAWRDNYYLSLYSLPDEFNRNYSNRVIEEWNNIPSSDSLNVFYCFSDVMNNVFMQSDKQLEKLANENLKSKSNLLESIIQPKIKLIIDYNDSTIISNVRNVGAMLPGANSDKTIAITAHYDHLGMEMGEIFHGADDNASGTAALLESARVLADKIENGDSLQHNILFLAFAAEELGLYGSEAWVNNPKISIDKTIININMDMIGRWDKKHEKNRDFVYLLTKGDKAKKMFRIGKRKLDLPRNFEVSNRPGVVEKRVFTYGSDHFNFYEKGIPIAVVFTGLHDEYHTPLDTPDKINYSNLTQITDFVVKYIQKLDNSKMFNQQ